MPRAALTDEAITAFREELCAVATRRFAESGHAGVTLRGLAKELGVSPMTPYRYFRDKDEIFETVRAAGFARFATSQERAFAEASDPTDRLRRLAFAYVDFARQEPDAYRIMFEMLDPSDHERQLLAKEQERSWGPLRRAVNEAIAAGEMAGDCTTVAHVFWAGLHGLVSLDLSSSLHHGATLESLIEPMMATLLLGAQPRATQEDHA
jgi:AcrR family transcriptional regulator